jgi:Na+/melibiose symporter-like transporter
MFNLCIGCENTEQIYRFVYYAPFVVIFQFGWAATQISHLSLIPQLTSYENERVALNAIRYAFTVMSNLFVYGVAFLLLKFHDSGSSSSEDDNNLSRNDSPKFMILSFIVCGVGNKKHRQFIYLLIICLLLSILYIWSSLRCSFSAYISRWHE